MLRLWNHQSVPLLHCDRSEYGFIYFVCCWELSSFVTSNTEIKVPSAENLQLLEGPSFKLGVDQDMDLHTLLTARSSTLITFGFLVYSTAFPPTRFRYKVIYCMISVSDFYLYSDD